LADTSFSKPSHTNGPIIKIYDIGGLPGPYAEAAAMLGWDSVNLQWVKIKVSSDGTVFTTGGGGGSGGGGQQYVELSTVSHTGTGNLILGEDTSGIVRPPTVTSFANSTAMAVQIVDASGNQITSFGTSTTTVVQGTASNLNATVVGTLAVTQSGGWTVTVTQATGTNLHVVVDNGTITTVPSGTQNVTVIGTVPVSGTITSIPSGTTTTTGTVNFSGSSTATLSGVDTSVQDFGGTAGQAVGLVVANDAWARKFDAIEQQLEFINTAITTDNRQIILGRVGPIFTADGQRNELRQDRNGALITAAGHAIYQEPVLRGNVFTGANAAGISANIGGTGIIGLIVYNPINSGKNLVLIQATTVPTTAPSVGTATALGWYMVASTAPVAPPTGTSVDTLFNNILGTPVSSVAKVFSTATVATALTAFLFLAHQSVITSGTAATGVAETYIPGIYPLNGGYIVPPGIIIALGNNVGAGQISSIMWEELPV
jgi:hypothetical protein